MGPISVIIPTYNGAHKIGSLFQALAKQALMDFEIIVIVDGSKDDTLGVLQSFSKEFRALRVISQPNMGRSKVRNRGASEATSDLLIFLDDDMIPSAESVKKHYEFHSASKPFAILSGNQIEAIEHRKTDIQNYKAWLTKTWTKKYPEGISQLSTDNLFFTAANCSIPREVFNRLGGFDEHLTDGEDFDFALRAIDSGIPVYFDKSNHAIHHDPITCRSYVKRLREYRQARIQLSKKFPTNSSVLSIPSSNRLKKNIYRIFAFSFFVNWIDKSKFLFLPRSIRYKLYDVVIHSLSVEFPNVRL